MLLGIETAPGLRWGALTVEGGRLSPDALRDALPAKGKFLRVLASSRREIDGPTVTAVRAVLDAGRSSGGLVVCDVPRHPSEVGQAVLELSDSVLVVVPATVAACVAAEKVGAGWCDTTPTSVSSCVGRHREAYAAPMWQTCSACP